MNLVLCFENFMNLKTMNLKQKIEINKRPTLLVFLDVFN
jgi:hypothetical protein